MRWFKLMKKIIFLVLVFVVLAAGCGAQRLENSVDIMKNVHNKYDKAKSIQVDFEKDNRYNSTSAHFKGTTYIKAPNKYFSESNVTIKSSLKSQSKNNVSINMTSTTDDGKNLWQISRQDQKKPIYSKQALNEDFTKSNINYYIFKEIDLQNKNYKLNKNEKLDGKYYYVMQLVQGPMKVLIWVNGDQWTVDKSEIYYTNSKTKKEDLISRSFYKNYKFNQNIPNSKFQPPKNVKFNDNTKSAS